MFVLVVGCERAPVSTTRPSSEGTEISDASVSPADPGPLLRGLAVGQRHGCTWTRDGAAVCWGSNRFDEGGRGDRSGECRPLEVPDLRGVTHMAAAEHYACAVVGDGGVRCFGRYPSRESGGSSAVTLEIEGGAVEVATADDYACARGTDGRVWCWGRGVAMGPEERETVMLPRAVPGLSGATALAVGSNLACAAVEDRPLTCWGSIGSLLSAPPKGVFRFGPTELSGPSPAFAPAISESIPCALDERGHPWCWVGTGSWGLQAAPEPVRFGEQSLVSLLSLPNARAACGWVADEEPSRLRCWAPLVDPAPSSEALLADLKIPERSSGEDTRALALVDGPVSGGLAGCMLGGDDEVMCWDTKGEPLWRDELAALTRGSWATELEVACRRVDGDGDGILDSADRCPEEPEVYNTVNDGDGCPDEPASLVRIDVEGQRIELLQKVKFAIGKDHIRPESFELLEHLAAAIIGNPQIAVVEIEGHTDSKSNEHLYGRRPTEKRAKSVRDFLVSRGVEPQRLESRGYGEDKPIASNRTAEGRALNRRIEVTIREWVD